MPLLLFLLCALWTPALAAPGEYEREAPIRRFYRTNKPTQTEYG
ncbi:hypothetical protein LMG28688_00800 [Paraburkholderia caffeinitolerans]|uniref:Uncharacterized protein n=1 Tax=Paraburkholderia caffeinitolerans TaxID=1723730 RepID=A0A6J5FJI8_9BURK|nr:hypothetical protein [Paraburkholderia caffeinitolerans]CAB3779314.1 hypothetical protein LMG28688_00800 [Paraburkholderia caffeinitolerans]